MSKRIKIIAGIIGVAAAIFGLLAYYQSQGILKIFPSREDRRIEQILTIDRSKFGKPEGLPDEKFEEEIAKLADLKKQIEQKPDDPTLWFAFAFTKDFLNDHEGSVAAWEKSFELQPLDFRTPVNMANVYQYFLKDYRKAEFYYREGLKLKADYTIAYQGLADLYRFIWKKISLYTIYIGIGAILVSPILVDNRLFFPFITTKVFLFRVVVEIIFLAFLALNIVSEEYRPKWSWPLVLLTAFVAVAAMSSLLGGNFYLSFWGDIERGEGLNLWLHLLAFFVILTSVVHTREAWLKLLDFSLGASLLLGFFGLGQVLKIENLLATSGTRVDATLG